MGSVDFSPYEGDEIKREMARAELPEGVRGNSDEDEDEDEEAELEEIVNRDLEQMMEFYDAYDLLPYASHIMWLASVKEALGYIPFKLDYFAIRCLVILKEEESKKTSMDMRKSREDSQAAQRQAPRSPSVSRRGVSVDLSRARIKR